MTTNQRVLSLTLVGLAFAPSVSAGTPPQTFLAGIKDDFALPVDPVSPPPIGAGKQFDELGVGIAVVHRFDNLPLGIKGARLRFQVRAENDLGGEKTDGVSLGFFDQPTGPDGDVWYNHAAWKRTFGPYAGCAGVPGCGNPVPDPTGILGAYGLGTTVTVDLDLSSLALPDESCLNLIPEIAERRYVDVLIGDDSTVDYIELTVTFDDDPPLGVCLAQPNGPGKSLYMDNAGLTPGHEYFNLISLVPCQTGLGTGPIFGLCGPVSQFVAQIALPVGVEPFHYVATDIHKTFGPFDVPAGLQLEAVLIDVTGGYVQEVSPVAKADTL